MSRINRIVAVHPINISHSVYNLETATRVCVTPRTGEPHDFDAVLIFYSTGSMVTAAFGTAVAVVLAYFDMPLIVVALAASAGAFAADFLIRFFS